MALDLRFSKDEFDRWRINGPAELRPLMAFLVEETGSAERARGFIFDLGEMANEPGEHDYHGNASDLYLSAGMVRLEHHYAGEVTLALNDLKQALSDWAVFIEQTPSRWTTNA